MDAHRIRQLARLDQSGALSSRAIARSLHLAPNTVCKLRKQLREKALTYAVIQQLDDDVVSCRLKKERPPKQGKQQPDWQYIDHQMALPGVTLQFLWEEYRVQHGRNCYGYSQFANKYAAYRKKQGLVMRLSHKAGECCFVDFAGGTVQWRDVRTNRTYEAQLFVGCLGCSHYPFAYAVASQSLENWILCHVLMLMFFGGCTVLIVCDNLKAGVSKPGRMPVINPVYLALAEHYGTYVMPARIRKAKDKAKVENMVLLVARWIMVKLNRRTFFSLQEINEAIAEYLQEMIDRPFKQIPGTRRSRFLELEKPFLKPLPDKPFEYFDWVGPLKVGEDYHVQIKHHFYSVPYTFRSETVYARLTTSSVEILCKNRSIATHVRSNEQGGATTLDAHRHPSHLFYAKQSPERYSAWAASVGPATAAVVARQFAERTHPAPAMKVCGAMQQLEKAYGKERLEHACARALAIGSITYTTINSLIRRPPATQLSLPNLTMPVVESHENVRGASYYKEQES